MVMQYGPDGVIITSGGGIGQGLYGHVQGGLGAKNDAATIASQLAQMNQTTRDLQKQGKPNLGQSAPRLKPPPPMSKFEESLKPPTWTPSKNINRDALGLPDFDPQQAGTPGGDAPAGLPTGWRQPGSAMPSTDDVQYGDDDATDRKGKSEEVRATNSAQNAKRTYDTTIKDMVEEVRKDPAATYEMKQAAEIIASQYREAIWTRTWTPSEVTDNPLVRELNNISVWSTFRRRVSEWQAGKNKLGTESVDSGDGSFATMVNGSFSSKTGTGNVPGFFVARDSEGLLYITDVDTWINTKMADMKADPALAAQTITALASIQAYGGDSAANSAAGSRVVTDADGNPVKAFVSNEDFTALKNVALLAVNSQTVGNQETLEDFFETLTAQSQEVYSDPQWEPPGGGSSGGGWGGGYGGGGGGGGGAGTVRYSDPEALGAQVDSIARQRMGRQLTPEEKTEFIAYYHKLEAQMTQAYYAGLSTTQLDPEGQAVGWIESRFAQERGAQQYGSMAARFVAMMNSSNGLAAVGN
jgi:hypothetical protein